MLLEKTNNIIIELLRERGDFLGKKIVFFMIVIAIVLGIVSGVKSVKFEDKESLIETPLDKEVITEIYRDELNLSISEYDTFNPLKTKNSDVKNILSLVYEPLISHNQNEDIEYILAESFAKLDSFNWIIKIRDDIKWHSGVNFSASDVAFTISTLRNNELTYSSNLKNVKEVEILSENSIKIVLNDADDFFISKLNFPVIPEYYFKGDNFNNESRFLKFVGTGPYKYSNASDEIIELSYNTSWWKNEDIKLKKIYVYRYSTYGEAVKGFKASEIDMIITNMSDWKEKFGTIGINSYPFENSEYEMIVPNCNNVALSENSVRRAILQAINRENIVSTIYNDNARISDIPIHNNSKNSITNAEYDVEKAKQILINASWQQTENGWVKEINKKKYYLNFTLMVSNENENKIAVAEKIKNNLEEIGIKITLNKVKNEKLKSNILQDNFELAIVSIDVKNEMFVQNLVDFENEYNYANYNSDAIKSIVQTLKIDKNNYDDNFYKFLSILKNDAPYIGLYFKTSSILTNKSVKGNFEPTWSNCFRNITSFCK